MRCRVRETSIVPADSIAGRALIAVIAIMTFLASLTTGAVMLVRSAAGDWQSEVAREVTIQVRPSDRRDIEADVRRAVEIARRRPASRRCAPTPRRNRPAAGALARQRAGARRSAGAAPDRGAAGAARRPTSPSCASARRNSRREPRRPPRLRRPHARHGAQRGARRPRRARPGAGRHVLSVMFATRGAMAANRPIVEVLHFVGAKNGFIAGVPAPLPAARPEGRRDRRRPRAAAVRARGLTSAGSAARRGRGAVRHVLARRAAMSRWSARSC